MIIVLLPGLDGTGDLFDPLIGCLSDEINARVIPYPNEKQTYSELIEHVGKQLPAEDFVLVGESFSGYIAYQIALQKPEHLKGVIFIASFITNPRPKLSRVVDFIPKSLLAISPPDFLIKRFMLGLSIEGGVIRLFKDALKKVSPDVLWFRLKEISLMQKLGEGCDLKALAITANNDALVPANSIGAFKEAYSQLTIIDVEGPHFILQAKPRKCAKAIEDFVSFGRL